MKIKPIDCVILANTKSRRLKNKIFLKLKNKSLLESAVSLIKDIPYINNKFIVFDRDDILSYQKINIIGINIKKDILANIGALGGIYTGLLVALTDYILFQPADMPFMERFILEELLSKVDNNFDAIVFDGTPLPGVYSKRIISKVEEFIRQKEYRLKLLLKEIKTKFISTKAENKEIIFFNLNTENDYKIAQCLVNSSLRYM